jgi:hypothetical protein
MRAQDVKYKKQKKAAKTSFCLLFFAAWNLQSEVRK